MRSENRPESIVCVNLNKKKCLTVTVVPQEFKLKLNRALALSVTMGTQLGSKRVVRLGWVGGMVCVVSTTAIILPSGKHTVRIYIYTEYQDIIN